MPFDFVWRAALQAASGAVLIVSVVGCNDGNAAGGAPGKRGADATTSGAGKGSYVLETQLRPEVPEKYFKAERFGYGVCIASAKMNKLPVKPFPAMPPGYVMSRDIYASDGKRFVHRSFTNGLDTRKMKPESACEARFVSRQFVTLQSDGQDRTAEQDEDGNFAVTDQVEALNEPVRASLVASYTQGKQMNGVALKCDEASICIVDPKVALVAEGWRPVQVAFRDDNPQTHGTALIREPVSLVAGKPVDPALFLLEAK